MNSLAAAVATNPGLDIYIKLLRPNRGIYTWPSHGGTDGVLNLDRNPSQLTLHGTVYDVTAAPLPGGGIRLCAADNVNVFDVGIMLKHPRFAFSIIQRHKVGVGVYEMIGVYVT